MNFELSQDHKVLQSAVRDFEEKEIMRTTKYRTFLLHRPTATNRITKHYKER